MRIIDQNGVELADSEQLRQSGHFEIETIQTVHHPAEAAVPERWHFETTAEFPNGGREVIRVVDTPGQPPRAAWWETETVERYTPYTANEAAQLARDDLTARLRETDTAVLEALEALLSASTLDGFLSALLAAGRDLRATLDLRAALRAQISENGG